MPEGEITKFTHATSILQPVPCAILAVNFAPHPLPVWAGEPWVSHEVKNRLFYILCSSSIISGRSIPTLKMLDLFSRRPDVPTNLESSLRLLYFWCGDSLKIVKFQRFARYGPCTHILSYIYTRIILYINRALLYCLCGAHPAIIVWHKPVGKQVVLRRVREYKKISLFWPKFCDQMHEHNAGKRKDRIQVYPSILLRCVKRWRTGDTTQRNVLHHIVNRLYKSTHVVHSLKWRGG